MKGLDEIKTDNRPAPKRPRRKQTEIPGFERQVDHPEVEAAAQELWEATAERKATTKKLNDAVDHAQMNLLAVMRAHKVPRYKYRDEEGEFLEAVIEIGEEKAIVRKAGVAEPEIGQGGADVPTPAPNGKARPGLIDQALKAQADAGVEENADGDVVPPEKSAKKIRGRKGKVK